nr:MAG: hypothetical protein [Bacteriophage sp.]
MFEQVKDYKSACKVLGIKPIDKRRKLEEHVLVYIQLSTITQAINFIANGNKQWIPKYEQNKPIRTWYSWWYIDWNKIEKGSGAGFFGLYSGTGVGLSTAYVGTHLRFINRDAAEYAAETFRPLYMKHIFGID